MTSILGDAGLLVRTSWLHGVAGPNFVDSILKYAAEKDELRVVSDQRGSPTWAPWLAEILLELMQKDARGLFHACSRGDISWFDFAEEIVRLAGFKTKVLPQSTEELGREAPRPSYSTLDVSKLENFLGRSCIDWKAGLQAHLEARGFARGE